MSKVPISETPRRIARAAAGFVVLSGVVVLLGWLFDIVTLKSVLPGLPQMAPLSSLLFVIAGIALWCVAPDSSETASAPNLGKTKLMPIGFARICVGLILLLSATRLVAYLFGWNLGLDLLGFNHIAPISIPTRTAPATALNFGLLGGGLLLASTSRLPRTFQFLVLLGSLVGWLGLSHYLYGGEPLLPYAQMAPHTAVAFLVLSTGILNTRPKLGIVALLSSQNAGGVLARRLVPSALMVPLVLGWLRLQGQRAGWFGTEAGVSLFALANVVIFGGLIWANAALLDRSDSERAVAETKAHLQLARLNLLQEITRAIGGRLDLKSIYQVVLQSVEENLNLDFSCICNYDPTLHALTVIHVGVRCQPVAIDVGLTEHAHIPIDANGLSRCVHGHLVYEPDIAEVRVSFPEQLARAGLHSLVAAPLLVESKVFGVFVAARRERHSFTSNECEFLRQLNEHVALAAHQAELHGALQGAYDDLQQTQEAVMQQERLRALGQMASGVAHDINNALSPVMLCTESLLENEKTLSSKGRDQLEIIQRAIGDAAQTVGRMREFYRKREPQLALVPVHVNKLVQQVMELTRARWNDMPQQEGIMVSVETALASDAPPVLGIESEIREALINLVFNAVDAMPNGGTLTLRTRVSGQASSGNSIGPSQIVNIEVADTGVGMDEETRLRCAEPFFTTKGERGTGLGLAMVYGIMRRHGADLEIESCVGKGTTVHLRFAAQPVGAPAVKVDSTPVAPPPLRILVVDDDPVIAKSLRDVLQGDGHFVFAAVGGEAGIEAFQTAQEVGEPFSVVLTDLGMPHIDGRKVAMVVKSTSPSTPVVLLTGWGQRLVAEGDVPPQVDHVLSKPPKILELRAVLAICSSAVPAGGSRLH